jgi:pyruvate dehydrogenase E1 component alpha subunit
MAKKKQETQKPSDADLNRELLRSMLLQRRFEERTAEAYALGKIGGFCHLYIGQEAVSTGSLSVLRPDDYIITTYRDHGQALARGITPRAVMAELFGRIDGCARGKGGSMHMFDKGLNFLGGHGIVGAHVPLATGVGFAIKYRGGDQVCICFMGESVVNTGAFHEALNMAGLWKLPVVYVIENNRYGMGTSVSRASARTDLFHRGVAYGIPGEQVDGMDVVAVHAAGLTAAEHARSGQGPMILEMLTYRYRGHSMSDPAKYRSKEEVDRMRTEHDPITHLRQRLIDEHDADENDLKQMEKRARDIVLEAAQYAQDCPEPDPSELWTDVLVEA